MNTSNSSVAPNGDITIGTTFSAEFVEKIVRDIMDNCPECSSGLTCIGYKYKEMLFTFVDEEDGKKIVLDKAKLMAAFPLLFTDKYPKGCGPRPPLVNHDDKGEWDTWLCDSDATSFDAFIQLAAFGEVIYG